MPIPRQCDLNGYEQILECNALVTEGFSSVLADASRVARSMLSATDDDQRALGDVAAGVIGPCLVAYVIWVLDQAAKRKLQRLYFVSRDGQILLEIARRLAPRLAIRCELRYLFGSRQAWHLAGVSHLGPSHLSWILEKAGHLTIADVLGRISIEPWQVKNSLRESGFKTEQDWQRELTSAECDRLPQIVLSSEVRVIADNNAAAKRNVARRYLVQEGLDDHLDWAIVDLGWSGRIQESLACILDQTSVTKPLGFYFGLTGNSASYKKGERCAYFFDGREPSSYRPKLSGVAVVTMMEMFCAGDHGLVVGYECKADRVEPVLKEMRNEQALKWGLATLRETVVAFVDQLVLDREFVNTSRDLRPVVEALLSRFWAEPSPAEARAWGEFPFDDDQVGTYYRRLGEPYRWNQVVEIFRSGRLVGHAHTWRPAALLKTPLSIRAALKCTALIRRGYLQILS